MKKRVWSSNENHSRFFRGTQKRGLEMAVTTVILIILSIAVLTVLVVFFNSQTSFLSKWFRTQSTESNVDAVVSACDALVTTESFYAYCCEEKEVVLGGRNKTFEMTCDAISGANWSAGRVRELECPTDVCS